MISKSIKKGTLVFNEVYGFGRFVCFQSEGSELAIIQFEDEVTRIHRKQLNEVEERT